MAVNLYSNCSTITTGCFFYYNQNLTSPVSDGKYSDGTNCYTVSGSNGEVTAVGACSSDVYISLAGPGAFDGSGDYNYVLYSDTTSSSFGGSPINVNTTVTAFFTIYAEFNDYYGASGAIGSGYACAQNAYIDGNYPYQLVSALDLTSVSPGSSGGYTYLNGGDTIGSYSCP